MAVLAGNLAGVADLLAGMSARPGGGVCRLRAAGRLVQRVRRGEADRAVDVPVGVLGPPVLRGEVYRPSDVGDPKVRKDVPTISSVLRFPK